MLLWYNDALMSPVTDYEVRVSLTGTKQREKRVGFHTEKESVQIVPLYTDQNSMLTFLPLQWHRMSVLALRIVNGLGALGSLRLFSAIVIFTNCHSQ